MKLEKGVTLIELVMTIMIVGIMASAFISMFLPQVNLFFFLPNAIRVQNASSDVVASIVEGDRLAKGLRYAEPDKLSKITHTVGITAADPNAIAYTYFDANRVSHTAKVYLDTVDFSMKRQIDGGTPQILSNGGAPGTGGITVTSESAALFTPFKFYNISNSELTGAAIKPLDIYFITVTFYASTGGGNVKQQQSQTLRKVAVKVRHFVLQNSGEWEFQFAKWTGGVKPDLVGIKKNATGSPASSPVGSRKTEVHIYNGNSAGGSMLAFATASLQTDTALEEVGDNFDFLIADCGNLATRVPDGTLDLVAIKKNQTPSGEVEIHIYDGQNIGAGIFKIPILENAIGPVVIPLDLKNGYEDYEFQMGHWKPEGGSPDAILDLFVIKKKGATGTEVHVLDGATNFRDYFTFGQLTTAVGNTDNKWTFQIVDWNLDGYVDLACIQKRGGGSGKVEVHIWSGAPNAITHQRFQTALLHATSTLPPPTVSNLDFRLVDWDNDTHPDLVWVQRNRTGSNTTEVHALSCYDATGNLILVNGGASFSREILDTATGLHETNNGKSLTVP